MASRKEQKEALRREREERERAAREAERRRRLVGYGVGGGLALAALVAVVVVLVAGGGDSGQAAGETFPKGGKAPTQQVTDLTAASRDANCTLQKVKVTSRDHTQSLSDRVKYSTNPPTSGKHFVDPAADGVYGKAPQDEQLVHPMEHGRVIFWVKPSLPEAARANLKALFDQDPAGMILVPRANMSYAVAATAWGADPQPLGTGYLMGCRRYSAKVFDALRTFRDEHRGKGPEAVPF